MTSATINKIRGAIRKVAQGVYPVLWLTGSGHWARVVKDELGDSVGHFEGEITTMDLLQGIEDSEDRTLILMDTQLSSEVNEKFATLYAINEGVPIHVSYGDSEEIKKTFVKNKGGIIIVSDKPCPIQSVRHVKSGNNIHLCQNCDKITINPDKDTMIQKHPNGARTCKGRIVDWEATVHIYFCKHCQAPGFHALSLPLDPDFEESERIKILRPIED